VYMPLRDVAAFRPSLAAPASLLLARPGAAFSPPLSAGYLSPLISFSPSLPSHRRLFRNGGMACRRVRVAFSTCTDGRGSGDACESFLCVGPRKDANDRLSCSKP